MSVFTVDNYILCTDQSDLSVCNTNALEYDLVGEIVAYFTIISTIFLQNCRKN